MTPDSTSWQTVLSGNSPYMIAFGAIVIIIGGIWAWYVRRKDDTETAHPKSSDADIFGLLVNYFSSKGLAFVRISSERSDLVKDSLIELKKSLKEFSDQLANDSKLKLRLNQLTTEVVDFTNNPKLFPRNPVYLNNNSLLTIEIQNFRRQLIKLLTDFKAANDSA